jgi:hypothetical protein
MAERPDGCAALDIRYETNGIAFSLDMMDAELSAGAGKGEKIGICGEPQGNEQNEVSMADLRIVRRAVGGNHLDEVFWSAGWRGLGFGISGFLRSRLVVSVMGI